MHPIYRALTGIPLGLMFLALVSLIYVALP